jgi:glycogen operon protein
MGAEWQREEGSAFPLGVSWVEAEGAFNFALYSKHADAVELCIYCEENPEKPVLQLHLDYLKNKSGPIWHCRIAARQLTHCRYYAYRIRGPGPGTGFSWHTFDPEKLLLDPYVRAVYFPPKFNREAARMPGSNEGRAPLGVLPHRSASYDWTGDRFVRHTSDLIIYEMHVRGFTVHPTSGVSTQNRGTFNGVVEKIPYLLELGVTAVELMPVFQFDPQEGNYWGYMPLGFFAPHHSYSANRHEWRQDDDFRDMVRQLHEAGIEVILDVVYNHTTEGDEHGPTYSFKGIDNSSYYILSGDPSSPYRNFSGTGNTLHTSNRAVRQLIVDSLRYWVKEMHVDGFRFDLASIFALTEDGEVNLRDPPIFGQISAEPELATIRLIAEPWDAVGVSQLGSKFPGQLWMQWNDSYRDTVRRFVRGDPGLIGDLMTRIYGSDDHFPDDRLSACRPWQSINYVSSHDGFTLYDMVSYNEKRNLANGHNNQDGERNGSWNCGWEGDEDVPPQVVQLRKRQVKNFCCLLMLSNGTPMFRMGDEFLHTQQGNNNPYNQDNEISWLNWIRLESNRDVFRFFQKMIAFRKAHPSLSRAHFWRSDVAWYGVEHSVDMSGSSRSLAFCLHGESQNDADLYVMINCWTDTLRFGIHEGTAGQWRRIIDTSADSPRDFLDGDGDIVDSVFYEVAGRSVVVLIREN